MATAVCLNDDCGKDEWNLTKHPDEYARGVTCPECGTTRVETDAEPRDNTPERTEQSSTGAVEPATEAQEVQRRRDPEISAGEGLLAMMDDDADANMKAKGIEAVGSSVIRFAKSALQYGEQKGKMKEERAKNAQFQKAEDKPRCEECGHVFSEIPLQAERISCPGCGEEYVIHVEG